MISPLLVACGSAVGYVGFAGVRWIVHRNDPYWREGDNGNLSSYRFKFRPDGAIKTLGGFRAQISLRGQIFKKDKRAFKNARMLEPGQLNRLLQSFYDECVRPVLDLHFLAFQWTAGSPSICVYSISKSNVTGARLDCDRDGYRIVEMVRQVQGKRQWMQDGCVIELEWVKFGVWDRKLIQENYKMLSIKEIQNADLDPTYILATESAVVAAMQKLTTIEEAKASDLRDLAEQIKKRPRLDIDEIEFETRRQEALADQANAKARRKEAEEKWQGTALHPDEQIRRDFNTRADRVVKPAAMLHVKIKEVREYLKSIRMDREDIDRVIAMLKTETISQKE